MLYGFIYKQHFYKQRKAKIDKKFKQVIPS